LTDPLLADLGWSADFMRQLELDEIDRLQPARVAAVHRDRLGALTTAGPRDLLLPTGQSTGDMAVGDWVLADPATGVVARKLDRRSTLQRGSDHMTGQRQLIAANIDTLFITTSCNADFNPARLERYLALAHDAGIVPVILLTKADLCDDPETYRREAEALGRGLVVLALNALGPAVATDLAPWTGRGQTVALAGSSGVGKTTVANALTGEAAPTQGIREDDARGRHTTTSRSLHSLPAGGWLIDTPGMRGLGVADVAEGIAVTFAEITELADQCRFRDCMHETEPGCAVQAAIANGTVDAGRLTRWRKLQREDRHNSETIAEAHARNRRFGRIAKDATRKKR
jgi:ribosome biogenesis GTPase